MTAHPFAGRSLTAIRDLNRTERLYLYDQTRRLKQALAAGDTVAEAFRIDDPDFGMYEIFLEDSTRTRESFKNAALFHRIKLSELNAASSSFNKKESYADTIANLVGYGNRVFVLRTALEGVCRHLAEQTDAYRRRHGIDHGVSFINAGDGRHEHPTQELLDEFTFLEDLNWSSDSIHLALVGDLYHGRTVHSKVHGLDLFSNVRVDLVAPSELAMPAGYVNAMTEQGFAVRQFDSISSYLAAGDTAPQWYFTRPQLERMGERVLRRQDELRGAITFTPDLIPQVGPETRFYHPLPRHREHPTVPRELDDTPLNAWERQSANGYLVRIALLAMVAGKLGDDYRGPVGPEAVPTPEYAMDVAPTAGEPKRYSEGVRPIHDGLVIDHICTGDEPEEIRRHMTTLQAVVGLNGRGGEWVSTGRDGTFKGILFRPGFPEPDEGQIATLAAVVPGATINVVRDGAVARKVRLLSPARISAIPALRCGNPQCITDPAHGEQILPSFVRIGGDRYACEYCSHDHGFKEIWR
ncbi:MAG: aspartate carbamoyltransferase [Spirochaeta sp.]|jgi:aspartate carbamoyltransferase|nr:aspartate carbamoyltransferase [Spirochaeta sp.]